MWVYGGGDVEILYGKGSSVHSSGGEGALKEMYRRFAPCSAVARKDGKPVVEVEVRKREKKEFSPEEVSAMILTKMKETAEVSPYERDRASEQPPYVARSCLVLAIVETISSPSNVGWMSGQCVPLV